MPNEPSADSPRNEHRSPGGFPRFVDEEELATIVAEQRRLQLKISEQNRILRQRQEQLLATVEQLQQREADASRLAVFAQTESQKLSSALDELRLAQDRLLLNEKLAAIGQLAASVSHELRNPLGAIRNAWYFIKKRIEAAELDAADQRIGTFSAIIDAEMARCAKIIGDLLDFSRERELHLVPCSLHELIHATFSVIASPSEKIELRNEVPETTPAIYVDEDQFRQVLVNLIQNAVEAVDPETGKVIVSAQVDEQWADIRVIDNGSGIPAEIRSRIFEPLYTSKLRGTGLGLSIVAGIVQRHGGDVTVSSEPGSGSTFHIRIPLGEPSYGARVVPGGAADLRKG